MTGPAPPTLVDGGAGVVAAAIVAAVIAGGVSANFSSIRTPNDGVYYVAGARALLETGMHVDATVIPYGLPITRQNGIVYVLAGLMAIAGDAWPVLYVVLVAALWTAAVVAMSGFFAALTGGTGGPWSVLLALCTFCQYDLLNDSTSFMNEGVYAPVLFLLAASAGRRLVGARTSVEAAAALAALPRWQRGVALVFVVSGLFFRNQHVVLLPIVAMTLWLCGRRLAAVVLPGAAIAAFGWYASSLAAPVTDGYLQTVIGLESLERSDLPYAMAMFTGPFWLTKVLPYAHPVVIVSGLSIAVAVAVGLGRLEREHPILAWSIGLYLAGTVAFLALLPFVSTRYFALANLPLVAALSVLLPSGDRVWRIAGGMAMVVAVVVVVYVRSYLSLDKHEDAYPQLVAHQRAASVARDALVYSTQPRMVWWVLGTPACVATPAECAAHRAGPSAGSSVRLQPDRAAPNPVIFIGRDEEIDGQDGLRGYRVARPLTVPVDGYAAWTIEAAQ